MCVVCTQKEEYDRNAQKKFFGWSILVSVVDLLPHIQVVVGSGIEFKWDTSHIVEHQVRTEHVDDVDKRPRCFLRDSWNDVEKELESNYAYDVDSPGS